MSSYQISQIVQSVGSLVVKWYCVYCVDIFVVLCVDIFVVLCVDIFVVLCVDIFVVLCHANFVCNIAIKELRYPALSVWLMLLYIVTLACSTAFVQQLPESVVILLFNYIVINIAIRIIFLSTSKLCPAYCVFFLNFPAVFI